MAAHAPMQSPAFPHRLPGTWKLAPGRAVSLRPREDGVLRVAHGHVWVTFDGPHAGPLNDLGDRVLGAGEEMQVLAGRRVVLEPNGRTEPAYFSWEFASAPEPVRVERAELVLQPLHDLRLALGLAGGAAARLAAGLARLLLVSLLPRAARPRGMAT
jgi:Protein of unknown function (DUF2917)